jgi:hypothetical protein
MPDNKGSPPEMTKNIFSAIRVTGARKEFSTADSRRRGS